MDFILSVLHSIGFNWHVALANFINFLIILFVLNKFVFKKVMNTIDERDGVIKRGLENASLAETNLKTANTDAENILIEARKKSDENIKNSIDKAEVEARNVTLKAEHDANLLRTSLNEKIANAEEKVSADFAKIAPEMLANMLRKTLGANMDSEIHNKFLNNIVK
jgi:F-type H+-transporting ATPase subunit b